MPATLLVVLDTNVWISGVFFRRGIPARILDAWAQGRFQAAFIPETLAELEGKLREKAVEFGASPALADEWLALIRTWAHLATATTAVKGVCRDPADDVLLSAALSMGATLIVSGDHDLQALSGVQGISVLSPRAFALLLGLIEHSSSP